MTHESELLVRSSRLADARLSLLIVVDVQERLLPIMPDRNLLLWNVGRLMQGATLLDVRKLVTEQYPERLGATVGELTTEAGIIATKRMFSCRECAGSLRENWEQGKRQAIICGLETHVCVLQTALDLLDNGWQVHVVADAVCSRNRADHDIALGRLQSVGCTLTTTEAVLFEWCETSLSSSFKGVSQLVRQPHPGSNV